MDKQRRPRVLGVSNRIFFLFLLLFTAGGFLLDPRMGAAELALTAAAFALYARTRMLARRKLERAVSELNFGGSEHGMSLMALPLPSCVIRLEDGDILWSSPEFCAMLGKDESRFEVSIKKRVPSLPLKWLKEGKNECPGEISIGARRYRVRGTMARSDEHYITALLHFIDITDFANLREENERRKLVIGIVALDNYEELLKGMADAAKSALIADIDEKIGSLAATTEGVLRKYDRDRHVLLFERRYLSRLTDEKYAILEQVRAFTGSGGIHATLSIGLGCDGETVAETMAYANLAVEMALSRGGDQAVVKDKQRFEFYGGQSKELEKRAKVKSRVMANALGELIRAASNVMVMGHAVSDIDTIGAACGLAAVCRKLNRPVNIVADRKNTAAGPLIERLEKIREYRDMFIDGQTALFRADSGTLLIVVDTSRPEMTESVELLRSVTRVAMIDHHRRAATYIDNAALTFHEPYASSTCELVCELAQYLTEPHDLTREEADGMLAGIAMDTKNFTLHTGARTFEAAAYLRSAGADTVSVKKLFQSDLQSNLERYRLIAGAEMIREQVAVAVSEDEVSRVITAQAADELLSVSGVQASFVITRTGDKVNVSGRSLGDINVQVIAEKIGGGGHQTGAGAQLAGVSVAEAKERLRAAVADYFNERG